ncbi:MAG: DUF4153 domain-containing protein [Erysipelothrix sp.]|nr:DUF4153 domain-containing protein [Erysipelothrix sp.]
MKKLTAYIKNISLNVFNALKQFPTAFLSGSAIAILALMKVENYDIILNSQLSAVQYGLLFALLLSLVFTKVNTFSKWIKEALSLLLGIVLGVSFVVFRVDALTGLYDSARIIGFSINFILLNAYLILLSKNEFSEDYPNAFYFLNKAVFASLFISLVMFLGLAIVNTAISSLILSSHGFLNTLTLLILSFYVGYLLLLSQLVRIEHHNNLENNQFLKNLFNFALTPVSLILGVVLIIWSAQRVFMNVQTDFETVLSLVSAYTLVGIWLYLLGFQLTSAITKLFQKVYPFIVLITNTLLCVSTFKAYQSLGLRFETYFAFLNIGFALLVILSIFIKMKPRYVGISHGLITLALITSLPVVGLAHLPYRNQEKRLIKILEANEMLDNDTVQHADHNLSDSDKEQIENSIKIISDYPFKHPSYLPSDINEYQTFNTVFGFNKKYDYDPGAKQDYYFFNVRTGSVDVSDASKVFFFDVNHDSNEYRFSVNQSEYVIKFVEMNVEISKNGQHLETLALDEFYQELLTYGQSMNDLGNNVLTDADHFTILYTDGETSFDIIMNSITILDNGTMRVEQRSVFMIILK